MNYTYTEKDLDLISWDRINNFLEKIYLDVNNYIKENNLSIKYIVPIMRGGGIPAIILSHKFNVVDCPTIQLKYNILTDKVDEKFSLRNIQLDSIKSNECILLVEGNHATGKTANIAVEILREKFGENIKIIYVSLTRDYTNRNSVKNICYTTWGMTTNETKSLSKEECDILNINYNLVSVYPWENVNEELIELNKIVE